jgi:hypothetical protein
MVLCGVNEVKLNDIYSSTAYYKHVILYNAGKHVLRVDDLQLS